MLAPVLGIELARRAYLHTQPSLVLKFNALSTQPRRQLCKLFKASPFSLLCATWDNSVSQSVTVKLWLLHTLTVPLTEIEVLVPWRVPLWRKLPSLDHGYWNLGPGPQECCSRSRISVCHWTEDWQTAAEIHDDLEIELFLLFHYWVHCKNGINK